MSNEFRDVFNFIGSSLKKSKMPWFVADVSSTKGDVAATLKMTDKIHKATPGKLRLNVLTLHGCIETTLMAMSAFIEKLTIAVTPNARSEGWLKSAIAMFPADCKLEVSESGLLYVVVEQNIEKGLFPIQMMETARANAFGLV